MAYLVETNRWETGIYQFETSDPVMGGPNGIDNRPTRELANRTLWLKTELAKAVASIGQNKTAADQGLATKADKTVRIIAGNGLTGGNTLEQNITVALGLPGKITGSTTNSVSATSHTHEIDNASTTTPGVVKLNDTLSSLSTSEALTANQGRELNNNKADKTAIKFARPMVSAGSIAITLNVNSRSSVVAALGDNFIGWGYNQLVLHNNESSNITGLPITGNHPIQLDIQVMGGYSLMYCHYLFLGRVFFSRINWNNEVLGVNWIELYSSNQMPTANTDSAGIVQLSNTLTDSSTNKALAAAQGQLLNNNKADKAINITAGLGLTGGGDLSSGRNIALGLPGKITVSTTNSVSATSHTHEIDNASTTTPGLVKLNDTLSSQSTSEALTANQGRQLKNFIDNKSDLKTVDFSADSSSGHIPSGFYRNNGRQLDGQALPSLDIHINHPGYSGLAYARGIGFSYGGTWGVFTTSYDNNGRFLGTKKILLADDLNVIRRDYSRNITGNLDTSKSMAVSGDSTVYPDGRIVQQFHIKDMAPIWFRNEDAATGSLAAGTPHRRIPLDLWTAMPNKITDVRVTPIRAVNSTSSQTYSAEASEWIAAWSLFAQGNNKGAINIDISRFRGGQDELFDLLVIVEGY